MLPKSVEESVVFKMNSDYDDDFDVSFGFMIK